MPAIDQFLDAADIAAELVGDRRVATRWQDSSVLPRMSIGMLACHLGRQTVRAAELLPVAATDEPLDTVAEHYRRAAWVTAADLDDPALDRSTDQSEAALGHPALVARMAGARSTVAALSLDDQAADVVRIPWQGWSLRRSDFLLTRMIEIVTHVDDLARSVELPTPSFPIEVYRPVLQVLAELAVERHGQAAVTSALTRSERMPPTISAF
ncbi:maleylpyruvate isomerase N-terminal domain-containing protein [Microlunatus soli]|uniref:Mycothiol maleylpyruvate isomerase N-terminal domain-containing protein n=1 Tax=Microlunatus soli TaxID=630515 RepID=A0A1H1QSZ4_9ACTN|nr:maleylpyruvate isomerase N-terminal domain-containing protein [Microlunatus soli]SDS26525.1 Mycothiol maleylpyruvate isomerase N-terminal domain-containing protein [Microlunatus soli]